MRGSLPPFTEDGVLPAGDYGLTLEELAASPLVLGWGDADQWDIVWRGQLVSNLAVMVRHLWQVGIREVFVDGSFVEDKPHPNDIDGYFTCDAALLYTGELEARLQRLDPVWTWDPASRHASAASAKRQLPMWHRYRVELFPHAGQGTGIVDQFGNELTFPSAFRQSRSFKPKGIVKIEGVS
jgi:hypothetical protein